MISTLFLPSPLKHIRFKPASVDKLLGIVLSIDSFSLIVIHSPMIVRPIEENIMTRPIS